MSSRRWLRLIIGSAAAALCVVLASGDVASTAQPWPAARHDPQRTSRADVRGPARARLHREYRMGEASTTGDPVVSLGGRTYVNATYCIDPSQGCTRYWTTIVVLTPGGFVRLLDPDVTHEYSGAPALGADGTVFASRIDGGGSTVALAPDGTARWTAIGGLDSPVLGPDGAVHTVAPAPGPPVSLVRLDPDNGAVLSSAPIRARPGTELAVAADGTVFYGEVSGVLVAMATDGTMRWGVPVGSVFRGGPMLAPDGTVYVSTDDGVLAVNADGGVKWRVRPVDAFGTGAGIALAADGTVYAITLDGVTALNPDGSTKWQQRRFGGSLDLVVGAHGSVFFASPVAIVGLGPGGNLRWVFPLLRGANTIFGVAIGGDGTLMAVGNRFSYALER